MLRDITIGQYFPGHSFIHKMDPRMKLIAGVLYIIVLSVASRPLGMALGIALVVLMYMISGISAKLVVKSLKPVVPIIIFTAILNLFFLVGDGEPIFSLWFLHIYREGVAMAIMMAVRIMCLIAGTSLLTYTTSPIELTDAIEVLKKNNKKFQFPVEWGVDIQTEHERYLTEVVYKKPVFVTDYPKEIKSFYMKQNADGKTVAAADMLVPGIGELIGGSQREEDYGKLVARMDELGMDKTNYEWYLNLRKFGGVEHAGYGLGFERMIMYLTGIQNIRDVLPFPRTAYGF